MECIKKLHDKLDQVDKVRSKLVKFVNLVMQIYLRRLASDRIRHTPRSLVIVYVLFNFCLIITLTNMAKFTISDGIESITGALKKTTEQGVNHITVTKKKHFHDPLTGEETGTGPNELFIQNKRDYAKHPLTQGETRQRGNWAQACREAQVILHDKSHPRFMELYQRWKEHLQGPKPHKQFPPFVRTVLLSEQ